MKRLIELANTEASRVDVLGRSAMTYAFANPRFTAGSLQLLNQAGAKMRGPICSVTDCRFQAHHIEFGAHRAFHDKLRFLLSVTALDDLKLSMLNRKEIRRMFCPPEKNLFLGLIHANNERRKKQNKRGAGTVQQTRGFERSPSKFLSYIAIKFF